MRRSPIFFYYRSIVRRWGSGSPMHQYDVGGFLAFKPLPPATDWMRERGGRKEKERREEVVRIRLVSLQYGILRLASIYRGTSPSALGNSQLATSHSPRGQGRVASWHFTLKQAHFWSKATRSYSLGRVVQQNKFEFYTSSTSIVY